MPASSMRPRLGFLGVGWIGRHRMQAILETGAAEAVAILDPSPDATQQALRLAPQAQCVDSFDALLDLRPDGVVIASPSAAHAEQSIAVLRQGMAVFCQKPLGRDASEVRAVLDAARRADRLLGVDLSYRYTAAMSRIRGLVEAGELGRIHAVDLLFHNAYGPDKPWFYDPTLSGGGCVMDLGVHLVDLALWTLGFPRVEAVTAHLSAGGEPLGPRPDQVEDYASAMMTLEGGAMLRMACSWKLQAGCDAIIAAGFHGTEGGAALRNIGGSFYDFVAERYRGTATETLVTPPDAWGGRAAADWALRLAAGSGFDPSIEEHLAVVQVLDRIYGR
jgi:predicted dehydrogenase